jgi:hypothetical protein
MCVLGQTRVQIGCGDWGGIQARCRAEGILRIYMHLVDEVDMSLYSYSRPSQGPASPAVAHGLAG